MSKTRKVRLDINEINDLIKDLQDLKSEIKRLPKAVAQTIAERGIEYLDIQYAGRLKDPNITDINTEIREKQNGYSIVAYGKDVIYEEFGTGDEGAKHPHVEKAKYNLNPYNSGKYIRTANPDNFKLAINGITSGKYWTYKKNGVVYYTQGVVAGMEMFKTQNYLRNTAIKEVLKEKASDVLSKV